VAAREEIPTNDPVIAAIDELTVAVEANVEDERALAGNLRKMRSRRARGASTRDLLSADASPSALSLIGRVMVRFATASALLRRALARDLRSEGESVTAIARLFGVTHQRASTLLRNEGRSGG
jgi:hypothetical protein